VGPAMSDFDEVDFIHAEDQKYYETSKEILGEATSLYKAISDQYQLLLDLLGEYKPHDSTAGEELKQFHANTIFLCSCKYQFVTAIVTILRGHLSDSYYYTRKAIELCCFASKIKKHPHLAGVWLDAQDNDESYEKFRKKFSSKKIFQDEPQLEALYDFCSKTAHSTIYSMTGKACFRLTDIGILTRYNYYELSSEEPSEPIRTLLWTVKAHFTILTVFQEIFSVAVKKNEFKWKITRDALEGKLSFYITKYKAVILDI
jgi:hypothetical protein